MAPESRVPALVSRQVGISRHLPRLRRLFDLDVEPTVVDAHLERSGLAMERRGVRLPGALDGFEVGFRALLGGAASPGARTRELAGLRGPAPLAETRRTLTR